MSSPTIAIKNFVNRTGLTFDEELFPLIENQFVISKEAKKSSDRTNNSLTQANKFRIYPSKLVRMEMTSFDCCEIEKSVKNIEILRLLLVES